MKEKDIFKIGWLPIKEHIDWSSLLKLTFKYINDHVSNTFKIDVENPLTDCPLK